MEKTAYIIYLTGLTLSIIFFGAMHTYVYTLLALLVLLATLLLVLKGIRKDYRARNYQLRIQKTALDWFFVAMLGLMVFQMVPLPPGLLKVLSPDTWVVWEKSWPALAVIDGLPEKTWCTLANYLYPVRMSLVRWLVYGFFFFGLLRVLNSRRRIQALIYLVLAIGCFEALYGLMQAYSGEPHVLWKSLSNQRRASGTYINNNHFAAMMQMGVLLAVGFVMALADRKRVKNSGRKRKPTLKTRLSAFWSSEQQPQKRLLILFSGVVMGLGLIFSASRGGIVAGLGGLLFLTFILTFGKGYKRGSVIFLALFLGIAVYAVNIGVDVVVGRFSKVEETFQRRGNLAKATFAIFQDRPLAGVGVGNFKYAFPKYQPVSHKKMFVRYAHNDWAQYLSETGILGMCLLLGGMGFYLFKTVKLWQKRNDPFAVSLGAVTLAVMAALAVHAFYEFNLHIPANFLLLLAVMAVGYAALHLEHQHRRDMMSYRYYKLPLKYRGGVVLVVILGVIGWTGYTAVCHFMGEVYCNTVPNSTLNRDKHPPVGEILSAISWDSGNAEYWYKLGSADYADYADEKDKGAVSADYTDGKHRKNKLLDEWIAENLAKNYKGSLKNPCNLRIMALEKSVELNPFDAQYHLRLGWEYAHLWQEKDYHVRWLPVADISMDRAAYFAGVKNPHLHQELGNYWTMRSKSVLPNNPVHHEAWAKACWHYHKAQSLETGGALKRMKKEIREYVWNFYPDEEYVKEVFSFGF